jgi:FkbM family methyltransferase
MYDQFRWTNVSARRNRLTVEYEPVQPFFLFALADKAGSRTFLDIGANIGAYALFATLIPSITRIVAFEANPDTSRELRANLALNDLEQRIEVDERAVSDAPGTLTFGVVSKYSGANSVVDTSIHDRATFYKEVVVEAVTVDQLFGQGVNLGPLCMKIDVEGHEGKVLDGARAVLSRNDAVIQVEGYEGIGSGSTRTLEDLGYVRLTAVGPDHYYSNMDILRDPRTVLEVYECAMAQLIACNHRNKAVLLKRGDFALQLTGKTATIARELAKRMIGKHL